jgi:putative GTP pyrophosphokinase
MTKLAEDYASWRPVLKRCAAEAKEILVTILGQLRGSQLIRAQIPKARVKSLTSVEKKASREGWRDEEAIERLSDGVGFRIVCNNLEDVYRIRDAILACDRFRESEPAQDFIAHPLEGGYRALHLNLSYEVVGATGSRTIRIEIQIRTLAQDTWAELSHYDIYKLGDSIPEHIVTLAQRLAEILKVADDIASDIRKAVSLPLVGVRSEDDELAPEGIAFIYQRAFGRQPPDYLVRSLLRLCEEKHCYRLDVLDRIVLDPEIRQHVAQSYESAAGWELDDGTWMSLAIDVAVSGEASAMEEAQKLGSLERAEIDAVGARDLEIDLPGTLDEFMESFGPDRDNISDSSPIYDAAARFDCIDRCSICSAPIVRVDCLVEQILDYYHIDEDVDGELEASLVTSDIEMGDWNNRSLCSYHGYVLSKDD